MENKSEIEKIADLITVIGPQYRGADYPAFNRYKINESEIPDNMRYKRYNTDVVDDGNIYFHYVTQEAFDEKDFNSFLYEVRRAIKDMLKLVKYTKPLMVTLDVESRDGSSSMSYDLSFNEKSKESLINENQINDVYSVDKHTTNWEDDDFKLEKGFEIWTPDQLDQTEAEGDDELAAYMREEGYDIIVHSDSLARNWFFPNFKSFKRWIKAGNILNVNNTYPLG